LTLLSVVKSWLGLHESEELAGGVSLEASAEFGAGFLGGPAGEVGVSSPVVEHPPVDDDVQCPVELPVAEVVEPVPGDAA
jgi:hypothetical protein